MPKVSSCCLRPCVNQSGLQMSWVPWDLEDHTWKSWMGTRCITKKRLKLRDHKKEGNKLDSRYLDGNSSFLDCRMFGYVFHSTSLVLYHYLPLSLLVAPQRERGQLWPQIKPHAFWGSSHKCCYGKWILISFPSMKSSFRPCWCWKFEKKNSVSNISIVVICNSL